MKRLLIKFLVTVSFSSTVFGTPQIPDIIVYHGKEYELWHSYPMESFFKKYPDKHPKKDLSHSTALKRGYLATFEMKGDQLYLKDIGLRDGERRNERGINSPNWKSVMSEVFPNQTLVKINWVTGLFVLPAGKKIEGPKAYVDYSSTYEKYIVLEMEKGILKREKELTYSEYEIFRQEQFEAFKKTDEYEKIKANLLKKRFTEKDINELVQYQIFEYSSKILVE